MNGAMLTQKSLSLFAAVGGWRTVAEAVASQTLFMVVYLLTDQVVTAALMAVGGVVVFTIIRVCTERKFWQPTVGLIVVGVSALLAGATGRGVDFYLPDLIAPAVVGTVFLVSMLVRLPVIGVLVEAVRGDRFGWRHDPVRRHRYQVCTAVFVVKFAITLALLVPLYRADQVVALGIASTVLSTPGTGFCAYVCWRILRAASDRGPS
jgi:hypothetical protein